MPLGVSCHDFRILLWYPKDTPGSLAGISHSPTHTPNHQSTFYLHDLHFLEILHKWSSVDEFFNLMSYFQGSLMWSCVSILPSLPGGIVVHSYSWALFCSPISLFTGVCRCHCQAWKQRDLNIYIHAFVWTWVFLSLACLWSSRWIHVIKLFNFLRSCKMTFLRRWYYICITTCCEVLLIPPQGQLWWFE